MKYLKKDFIADVISEATLLRDNATDAEKSRLNFERLDPKDYNNCIYGQMTGSCNSPRAVDLIISCCNRYIKNKQELEFSIEGFKAVKKQVNGSKVEGFRSDRLGDNIGHFSSIETYILLPNAKNENIINFIKGKTDRAVL